MPELAPTPLPSFAGSFDELLVFLLARTGETARLTAIEAGPDPPTLLAEGTLELAEEQPAAGVLLAIDGKPPRLLRLTRAMVSQIRLEHEHAVFSVLTVPFAISFGGQSAALGG